MGKQASDEDSVCGANLCAEALGNDEDGVRGAHLCVEALEDGHCWLPGSDDDSNDGASLGGGCLSTAGDTHSSF